MSTLPNPLGSPMLSADPMRGSGNPILDEVDNHWKQMSPQAQKSILDAHAGILAQQQPQQSVGQPPAPQQRQAPAQPQTISAGPSMAKIPTLGPAGQEHQAELDRLTAAPTPGVHDKSQTGLSGIDQIHNPWARIPLQIAAGIGSTFMPRLAEAIPGTQEHHNMLVGQEAGNVSRDQSVLQDQAKLAHETAQTNVQQSLPDLNAAKADALGARSDLAEETLQAKQDHDKQALEANLRKNGYKTGEDGNPKPLDYSEMSEQQQATHDYLASKKELSDANAELKKAQTANIPKQMKLAQERVANAQISHADSERRLSLSERTFEARYHGTDNGEALPGAMIGDDNKPVGTAFQQNVRPTGQERNKADLANSASDQMADLKALVHKRPEMFGLMNGRKTEFDRWLGSQDPDAQRFVAARTIAGDHLAGVFGGRSEAALHAIDNAIGQFKDNPAAVDAGLDQLSKANTRFVKAGTVKTAGSTAAAPAPKLLRARDAQGKLHEAPEGTPLPAGWKLEK